MSDSKAPAFKVLAKNKETGKYVEVGALFASQYGYNLSLSRGATITVTEAWDKDARAVVDLEPPVVVSNATHFINANPPRDRNASDAAQSPRVNALKEKAKETFGIDDSDIPF